MRRGGASVLRRAVFLLLLLFQPVFALSVEYPALAEESSEHGRAVWITNCEGCHGYGVAGSPNPMRPGDWDSRVSKPKKVLYENAILGFFGPDDTYMPPRGGNDNLSNDDVKSAVDYMLALARRTINTKVNKQ